MRRWIGPALSGIATVLFAALALSSDGWPVFWWSLLAVGGAGETVALTRRARGDTLSETVWDATDSRVPRVILAVFMAWLSWHFVADRRPNDEGDGRE